MVLLYPVCLLSFHGVTISCMSFYYFHGVTISCMSFYYFMVLLYPVCLLSFHGVTISCVSFIISWCYYILCVFYHFMVLLYPVCLLSFSWCYYILCVFYHFFGVIMHHVNVSVYRPGTDGLCLSAQHSHPRLSGMARYRRFAPFRNLCHLYGKAEF